MDPSNAAPAQPDPATDAERAVYAAELALIHALRGAVAMQNKVDAANGKPNTGSLAIYCADHADEDVDWAAAARFDAIAPAAAASRAAAALQAARAALREARGGRRLTDATDLPAELVQTVVALAEPGLDRRVRAATVCKSWAAAILRSPGPVWENVEVEGKHFGEVAALAAPPAAGSLLHALADPAHAGTASLKVKVTEGKEDEPLYIFPKMRFIEAALGVAPAVRRLDVAIGFQFNSFYYPHNAKYNATCLAVLQPLLNSLGGVSELAITDLEAIVMRMVERDPQLVAQLAPRLRSLHVDAEEYSDDAAGWRVGLFSNLTSIEIGLAGAVCPPEAAALPALRFLHIHTGSPGYLPPAGLFRAKPGDFPALRELVVTNDRCPFTMMMDADTPEDMSETREVIPGKAEFNAAFSRASMAAVARTLTRVTFNEYPILPDSLAELTGLREFEWRCYGFDSLVGRYSLAPLASLPALSSLRVQTKWPVAVPAARGGRRQFPALRRLAVFELVGASWPGEPVPRDKGIRLPPLLSTLHTLCVGHPRPYFSEVPDALNKPFDLAQLVCAPMAARVIALERAALFVGAGHKRVRTNTLAQFQALARKNLLNPASPPLSLHLHNCSVDEAEEGARWPDFSAAAVDWLRAELRARGRLCEATGGDCMFRWNGRRCDVREFEEREGGEWWWM